VGAEVEAVDVDVVWIGSVGTSMPMICQNSGTQALVASIVAQ